MWVGGSSSRSAWLRRPAHSSFVSSGGGSGREQRLGLGRQTSNGWNLTAVRARRRRSVRSIGCDELWQALRKLHRSRRGNRCRQRRQRNGFGRSPAICPTTKGLQPTSKTPNSSPTHPRAISDSERLVVGRCPVRPGARRPIGRSQTTTGVSEPVAVQCLHQRQGVHSSPDSLRPLPVPLHRKPQFKHHPCRWHCATWRPGSPCCSL